MIGLWPCCCGGEVSCEFCGGTAPDQYTVTFSGVTDGDCDNPDWCAAYWNDTFTVTQTENPCVYYSDADPDGSCRCSGNINRVKVIWSCPGGTYTCLVEAEMDHVTCEGEWADFVQTWESKPDCDLDSESLSYDCDMMGSCDFTSATCTVSAV